MVKLYFAMSIVDNFMGFDTVHIIWACHRRKEPVAPYNQLIVAYDILREKEKKTNERMIDRYFTENEIKELEEYLLTVYGWGLIAYEAEIPMKSEMHEAASDDSLSNNTVTGEGFLPLFYEPGCNLRVRVIGYYNFQLSQPTNCKCLSLIHRKFGEAFANLLFQKLKFPAPPTFREVVEEIYAEANLFVCKLSQEDMGMDGHIS